MKPMGLVMGIMPQRTILGTPQFLIGMNDFPNTFENIYSILCADKFLGMMFNCKLL